MPPHAAYACEASLLACEDIRSARFLARDSDRRSLCSLRRCMSSLW